MIIWAGKPHTVETKPAWVGAELRAWRWALVATPRTIEVEEQMSRGGGNWHAANRYVGVYLARRWHFAFYHLYHDGPHHSLWLGCLNVSWMRNARCSVCEPEARS